MAAWCACALFAACTPRGEDDMRSALPTGIRYLADRGDGEFERATLPREFRFPEDHASHPAFRTEWWYFTGNLTDTGGRAFGFELTFFRLGLAPAAADRPSAWGANQVWMAHFAVTDAAGGRFVARERFAREALGLAGATSDPLRIWLGDWSAAGSDADGRLGLRLKARSDAAAIDLELESRAKPVLQGEQGLDAKGPERGNASYYYSVPRLAASGRLSLDGTDFEVEGAVWLDREWSTSALSPGIAGWDWFALRLEDGRSLMFYALRREDGGMSPFSGGVIVDADGRRTDLSRDDVELRPRRHWTSPVTRVRYPVAWDLAIPAADLALTVEPYLENQELVLSVRYWEGAVRVSGRDAAGAVHGDGYLELAGY